MTVKDKRDVKHEVKAKPRAKGAVKAKWETDFTKEIARVREAMQELTSDMERLSGSAVHEIAKQPGPTVAELASEFSLSEDAVVAFVQTVGEVLGSDHVLSVEAARRGALLAASGQAWENELGPLLGTPDVRQLLGGVSRQRVDELLHSKRLIALPDESGHRRYPLFQFHEGRPLRDLIDAYWTVAEATASPWSAAAWCTAPDEDGLEGLSPVAWASAGSDAEHLERVARQDAARLAQ